MSQTKTITKINGGIVDDAVRSHGEVFDAPSRLADALIAAGLAEDYDPDAETAADPAVEAAVKKAVEEANETAATDQQAAVDAAVAEARAEAQTEQEAAVKKAVEEAVRAAEEKFTAPTTPVRKRGSKSETATAPKSGETATTG